ncbi:MAG TPA: hypothetical protein VF647_17985 [Longimicrobium sp.]|jgi:hypothetical protein
MRHQYVHLLHRSPDPVRRTPPVFAVRLRQLLFIGVLAAAGCSDDDGSVGAPEHFSPMVVDSPVGPLRLQLSIWPKNVVFRRPNLIMIHYRMVNPGPGDHAYRDAAEYYHFRVVRPNGQRLYPRVVSATEGMGEAQRILLYPGEAGETHTINLACMPYHAYSFEPLFRAPDRYGCEASFQFREAGVYQVIGQRVPPPAFGPEDDWTPEARRAKGEDTLPSRADTLEINFQPSSRWWPW